MRHMLIKGDAAGAIATIKRRAGRGKLAKAPKPATFD